MENETVYKPIVKEFLKQDVRVIKVDDYHEYIVCKDMFDALGLVKDGIWSMPKQKMLEFLSEIGSNDDCKTFAVMLKEHGTKRKYVKREVDCLDIEIAPLVLTQFKPTKRRGEKALEIWSDFMKFVKVLLEIHEAHKYIIKTKDIQKEAQKELHDDGGDPMLMNIHVNKIMGVVLQMEDGKSVKKSEIYQFQNRITEDVGRVRDEILKTYVTMFKVTEDKDKAYELTLEWSKKKYLK